MQIRPEIALKAALKALTEVIAPAVDPDDKMAQEQMALVIGLLTLVSDRLRDSFAYDRDELARLLQLAGDISPVMTGEDIKAALVEGSDTLERAKASPADVVDAIGALRSLIGNATAGLAARNDPAAKAAVRAVIDASAEQILRERSWVKMQGWESDPDSVPELATLLARAK